jgi:signal transduction histidine kinase
MQTREGNLMQDKGQGWRAAQMLGQAIDGGQTPALRRASLLVRAADAFGASLDAASLAEALAHVVVPELAEGSVVDLLAADGTLITTAVAHVDAALAEQIRQIRRQGPGSGWPREAARALGLCMRAAVPLRARGHLLGTLMLLGDDFTCPGAAERVLIEELATRASLAIDNAALYRDAQRASRLKDEFLATLAHELRTPLHTIVGWAHILGEGPSDPATVRKGVETIIRSAQAQARLVDDILDVSRIVTGKLHLDLREIDLAEPIEAALESARLAADAKGVSLRVGLDPAGARVTGDPDRLRQVVSNLLGNAIRFAPEGGTVELQVAADGTDVELTVADDGPGIRPEFLPHVFERFWQADARHARPHDGLGLGLAIARHLIERHGGAVRAENRPTGTGAVFRVRLPRRESAAAPVAAATEARERRRRQRRR